jgi:hypothetical protein
MAGKVAGKLAVGRKDGRKGGRMAGKVAVGRMAGKTAGPNLRTKINFNILQFRRAVLNFTMKNAGISLLLLLTLLTGCKTQPNRGNTAGSGKDSTSTADAGGDNRFTESAIQVMWVAPYTQRCVGEAEMDCMLVSFNKDKPAQGEWELFYDGIRGFTYEKGNLYQLKVKVGKLKPQYIMQDAGDREYILLEVLRKDGA